MSSAHTCLPPPTKLPAGGAIYRRRHPERTVLYQVFQEHLESYLEQARSEEPMGEAVPGYVEREFRNYLQCGILSYGFARAKCADCGQDFLVAYSLVKVEPYAPRAMPDAWRRRQRTSSIM